MVCKGSKCKSASDCDDCVKKNAAKRKKVRDATLLMKAKIMKNMKPTKYDTSPWFDNFASYRNLPAKQIALPPSMRTLTLEDVNKEIDIALLKRDTRKKVKPEKPVPFEAVSVPRPPPQLTSETQTDFELPTQTESFEEYEVIPSEELFAPEPASSATLAPEPEGPQEPSVEEVGANTLVPNYIRHPEAYEIGGNTPPASRPPSPPSPSEEEPTIWVDMSNEPTLKKQSTKLGQRLANALQEEDKTRMFATGSAVSFGPLPPLKKKETLEKAKAPVEPEWGMETTRKTLMEVQPRGAESFNVSSSEPLPSIKNDGFSFL